MALEQTLSIIKPDGVKRNLVGEILGRFEQKGLRIVATRMLHLSKREAEGFYAVHRDCLLYTSPSPRDKRQSRMPSSA